jgi:hypothetical protein
MGEAADDRRGRRRGVGMTLRGWPTVERPQGITMWSYRVPDHLFHFSLRSRCTATLAGLRTFIETRLGPIDRYRPPSSKRCLQRQAGTHGRTPFHALGDVWEGH